jgi:hypothetical protein
VVVDFTGGKLQFYTRFPKNSLLITRKHLTPAEVACAVTPLAGKGQMIDLEGQATGFKGA